MVEVTNTTNWTLELRQVRKGLFVLIETFLTFLLFFFVGCRTLGDRMNLDLRKDSVRLGYEFLLILKKCSNVFYLLYFRSGLLDEPRLGIFGM